MIVVIVFSGEYEDRRLVLVASNRAAADAAVRKEFPAPYQVSWSYDDGGDLIGNFDEVRGYSTKHAETFEFEDHEVL